MDTNSIVRYLLARCASQPTRFAQPKLITDAERIVFRALVALAFVKSSPVSPRVPFGAPSRNQPAFPFEAAFHNLDKQMDTYEREDLQTLALEHLPIQEIYDTADRIQATNTPLPCYEDALAEALVKWFKPNMLEWADPILCPTCGSKTDLKNIEGPRFEYEKRGGAGRVEVHECTKHGCPAEAVRFPRYNNLEAIIKHKKGRCGEFANLFMLVLRAVGLRARYVWNAEDHVWNEYFSPGLNRWVHLDSCENARDEHYLYSQGWGKKMSFAIAFSAEAGAIDVSRAYIPTIGDGEHPDWEGALQMREEKAGEGYEKRLDEVLKRIRDGRRILRSKQELEQLKAEDERDRTWWQQSSINHVGEPGGRISGTTEWKVARGEDGSQT